MLKSLTVAAAATGLLLTGCEPAANATKAPSATTPTAAAASPSDAALISAATAMIEADEDCTLLEQNLPRAISVVDLGSKKAVIAACSAGMVDLWSRLYLVQPDGSLTVSPLLTYDNMGDSEWHAEDISPNLIFDPATKQLVASIAAQSTGCGWSAKWRWDGKRVALAEMSRIGCEAEHSEDAVLWPTTPATPEPTPPPVPVD